MPEETRRHFATGPRMIPPAGGVALAAACIALAATQAWPVIGHLTGARVLAPYEPALRGIFGAIFVLAGLGVIIALLEGRNAAVDLDDGGLTVRSWTGATRRVAWDEIEVLGLLLPASEGADLPFHRLSLTTVGSRSIRLAGGPWQQTDEVERLRREIIRRAGLVERRGEDAHWAFIFAARRREWS